MSEGDLILGHLVAVRYRCVHLQHAAVLDAGLHGFFILDVGVDRLVIALDVGEQPDQAPAEEPGVPVGKRLLRRLVRLQVQRLAHVHGVGLSFRLHRQGSVGVLLLKILRQHILCLLQGHAAQILAVDLGVGEHILLAHRAAEHQIGDEHHNAQADEDIPLGLFLLLLPLLAPSDALSAAGLCRFCCRQHHSLLPFRLRVRRMESAFYPVHQLRPRLHDGLPDLRSPRSALLAHRRHLLTLSLLTQKTHLPFLIQLGMTLLIYRSIIGFFCQDCNRNKMTIWYQFFRQIVHKAEKSLDNPSPTRQTDKVVSKRTKGVNFIWILSSKNPA